MVVAVGQMIYAASYEYVYYCSIAFSAVSIIASCLLGNVKKYTDDHVAVVIHKRDLAAGDGGTGRRLLAREALVLVRVQKV